LARAGVPVGVSVSPILPFIPEPDIDRKNLFRAMHHHCGFIPPDGVIMLLLGRNFETDDRLERCDQ
jgi:hypothetical protein